VRFRVNRKITACREVRLLYYNDWQDISAVRREITEVIVIAWKVRLPPKVLKEKALRSGFTTRFPGEIEKRATHSYQD
jgi:hypothetical protein